VGKYCKAGQATDVNVIGRKRFAYWTTKATDTQSESVILIPLPRQQSLRERPAVSCYTYIECLLKIYEGIHYEFGPDAENRKQNH
jgi:hypothetical protein